MVEFHGARGNERGVVFPGGSSPTQAVDPDLPGIDFIEKFGADQVTIHFNTAAGKVYSLQSRDLAAPAGGEWTTPDLSKNG